jgi:hypothetical protein
MSIFGNLFSNEKKKDVKIVKKHSVKKKHKGKSKKHSPLKKSSGRKTIKKSSSEKLDKKREEKVSEKVFNSDREVENYYKQERERAKDFLKQVEKEKAASLLEVAKKQYDQIKNEKNNLDLLMHDLVSHARGMAEKTKELNLDKKNNKENINLIKKLRGSFYNLEKEAVNIVSVRSGLANKEKLLLDRMSKLALDSAGKLRLSDSENAERLLEIEKSKEKLLIEAKALLSQENYEMKLDDKVLDNIGRMARRKIKNLNRKLKDIRKERVDLLKKKQLLEISEEKVKGKLIWAEKRIDLIKRKFRRVLG